MNNLTRFRESIDPLIRPGERPFLCSGDPLRCRVFIVGFNPATSLDGCFWQYWSDNTGFDRISFMADYTATRRVRGARPRIEAIIGELAPIACLETNICSKPTRRAAQLHSDERRTEIFDFLLMNICPDFVLVHSNEPISYMQARAGVVLRENVPHSVSLGSYSFRLMGVGGPIWRKSIEQAREIGRIIASTLTD